MRWLHVHSGNLYGGVESMLVTMARHRDASAELRQGFALCFEDRLQDELRATGAEVLPLRPVRIRDPYSIFRARRKLRALLGDEAVHGVITHSAWSHAVFGPAVRQSGKSLVFWLHGFARAQGMLRRLARRTAPDLVIANSAATAATADRLFADSPCRTLYCPVTPCLSADPEAARRELRAELDAPRDATVIVQVSRMEAWKGHRLHLEALAALKARRRADDPGWRCWIVGGAQRPEEERYQTAMIRLCEELGLADRVRFLGDSDRVPELLAAADVFCQPNLEPEPFGIVFVEALYAGLPVVATPLGGPAEIVDESCGLLTPPGDAEALAEALASLIDDPELRRRLGGQAPQRARQVSDPARQLATLETLLAKVPPSEGRS